MIEFEFNIQKIVTICGCLFKYGNVCSLLSHFLLFHLFIYSTMNLLLFFYFGSVHELGYIYSIVHGEWPPGEGGGLRNLLYT